MYIENTVDFLVYCKNISTPSDLDNYDKNEFPYFIIGRALMMYMEISEENIIKNMEILSKVPEEDIRNMSMRKAIQLGMKFE